MVVEKKVIGKLEKCYSLSLLNYKGKKTFLAAAEKVNQCRVYNLDGKLEEVVWEEPGGAMSLVQVPDRDDIFLATHRFYSPNNSKEASIVSACYENGGWKVRTVAYLPFVHRFDILRSGRKNYLIASTLKSGHEYKDDWSVPGKVYGAVLAEDVTGYNANHPLELQVIKEGMLRNHGYFKNVENNREEAIIACEQGIFRFIPPSEGRESVEMEQLLDIPASDAAMMDLDGCGQKEMLVFSPFHGDTVFIFKIIDGIWEKVYEHPIKLPFLHAISCGYVEGCPVIFIGNRDGKQELLAVSADGAGGYRFEMIDNGYGPANVLYYNSEGKDFLLAANRESDELALYALKSRGE